LETAEIPVPPVAEALLAPYGEVTPVSEARPLTGDLESDLRALGLGETPVELSEPITEVPREFEEPVVQDADAAELGVQYVEVLPEVSGPAEVIVPEETTDLDELLRSLSGDVGSEGAASFEPLEVVEPATTGVISTDAYLAEFEDDVGLSSGLSDEITALTGGGVGARSRPVATVSRLPESGEGLVLHRDQLVDRDLVMKIIEGIEKL